LEAKESFPLIGPGSHNKIATLTDVTQGAFHQNLKIINRDEHQSPLIPLGRLAQPDRGQELTNGVAGSVQG
jgi:hypothetical protein